MKNEITIRRGGIWQEIDSVADDIGDLRTDMDIEIRRLEAHLLAMDQRIVTEIERSKQLTEMVVELSDNLRLSNTPVKSKSVQRRKAVQKKAAKK